MSLVRGVVSTLLGFSCATSMIAAESPSHIDFRRDIQPIFAQHCLSCHGSDDAEAGLRLTDYESITVALDSGTPAVLPHRSGESELIRRVMTGDLDQRMPPSGPGLSDDQIDRLRMWIDSGASWPSHWSLVPLENPSLPNASVNDSLWIRNAIDVFIVDKLRRHGLEPSLEADRRTLIRRLAFDLIGLPPHPDAVSAFVADASPDAYDRLVDRFLASPRYGERWARHWLDLVHYADTHGHDEDAIREHAWPYRDYVVKSFNDDTTYAQFIQEQIAGDVLFPDRIRGIVALGMLAAGPWDESSQMGIKDGTLDKEVARYLERDDMLSTVMNTFVSLTVHCARCHDHKFDPVSTEEYYRLQAVFAGIDRVDRPYDRDAETMRRRQHLLRMRSELAAGRFPVTESRGDELEHRVKAWEHRWHAVSSAWHVVNPEHVVCHADTVATVQTDGSVLFQADRPETDVYRITSQVKVGSVTGIRLDVLTDKSLPSQGPGRQENGNFHLNEFQLWVHEADGTKRQMMLTNPIADFSQEGASIEDAVDGDLGSAWGVYPRIGQRHSAVFALRKELTVRPGQHLTFVLSQEHGEGHLIGRLRISLTDEPQPKLEAWVPDSIQAILEVRMENRTVAQSLDLKRYLLQQEIESALARLPDPSRVYAIATDFEPQGNFVPARGSRVVHVLRRGDVSDPVRLAEPGTLSCVKGLDAEFRLERPDNEAERRAALARWVSHDANSLTWRSIANRVWHYHFGHGIVRTPSDFGVNGSPPSHPELLDWLAATLRDGGGRLKDLHRLIVTSATYRQATRHHHNFAEIDPENHFLWRMNRRRLDAEQIRDALLRMSGHVDWTMGGAPARHFLAGKGIHITPSLDYLNFDVDHAAARRRSVYRFVFRTVPDPFMEALDCPDASQFTPRREASVTSLHALAMLNSQFVIRYCQHLAAALESQFVNVDDQIQELFLWAYGRLPATSEYAAVAQYTEEFGLANAVRVIVNSNEFMFVN